MGRRSKTGGVKAKGNRIEFSFSYQGKRYRPTLQIKPTETNLRNARIRLNRIANDIRNGTFVFAEEFPEYKFLDKTPGVDRKTFREVSHLYLASIKSQVAYSTYESYRKILESFWIPRIGDKIIGDVRYSDLTKEMNNHPASPKTRNNIASVARGVFDFAVHDMIIPSSPAKHLKTLKVQTPPPDPYHIDEAEYLLAGLREDNGKWLGNYFEFSFFTGLRPSEAIALQWKDVDRHKGVIRVSKARVMARDKSTTKTSVEREVELNPRARAVLERQWCLTGLWGKHVFGHENGSPYHDLQVQWRRWEFTHKRIGVRYREPYQTRHSSVTWNLMIGKNLLWVSEQHGHSTNVMLRTYAKWLRGSDENTIEDIKKSMGFGTNKALEIEEIDMSSVKMAEREGFEPSS